MTKIVIDKENEITKLENMLETLTDEKDKQSVRFAINVISGFNEVLSDRHNPFISKYQHDFVSRPTEVVKVGEPLSNSDEINKAPEKGDIYRRGFEDGYLKGKEERPQGEFTLNDLKGYLLFYGYSIDAVEDTLINFESYTKWKKGGAE